MSRLTLFPLLSSLPLLLLLLALPLPSARASPSGPCAKFVNTTEKTFPAAAVWSCFGQIPYNADVAAATVGALKKMFAFMPSVDVALNSPTKELPLKVDIRKTLTDIGKNKYKSDLAFTNALRTAFDSLRDQNVQFLPYCYLISSEIAFPLVLFWEGGKPVVQIRTSFSDPSTYNKTSLKLKKDLSTYEFATVETIEGVPAYDYLLAFANSTAGGFKDVNARLNSLFVRPTNLFTGYYDIPYFSGAFSSRPYLVDDNAVSMKVKRVGQSKSEKLSAPWYATFPYGLFFEDLDSYYQENCNASAFYNPYEYSDSSKSSSERMSTFEDSSPKPEADLTTGLRQSVGTTISKELYGAELLVNGSISAWLLPDKKTGVLVIADFGKGSFFEDWYPSLLLSLFTLKRVANRIVIDVSDAASGYLGRVDSVLQFLFPSLTFTAYPYEFRATRLAQLIVEETFNSNFSYSVYNYQQYTDLTGQPMTQDNFFFPVVPKTFNGKKRDYSKQFTLFATSPILQPSYAKPLFKAKNILILTNGICYEKCAEFIFKAQEFAGIKTVAVGGISNMPMAVGGGVIGATYQLSSLVYDLYSTGLLADKDAPAGLPLYAYISFPILQAYCKQSAKIPADFVFKGADYRFDHTAETVMDRTAMWGKAAEYFV